jgi:kynurenine formamidase
MKAIDLSIPTEESPSEAIGVKINHLPHEEGAEFLCRFFGCAKEDLPDGLGAAAESVTLSSHAGTHIDAPWHYAPTSEGKRARTVDEMPLEWFFGDGVVLDMRHKPNGAAVTVDDIQKCLEKMGYRIKPFDIVLLQTGADKYWGKAEYFDMGCGLVRESTLWLLDQGVKVIGTDAWGLDRPFWAIRKEFEQTHDRRVLWQAHFAGIDKEYCQIEKLAHLDELPRPTGFKVACFPVKLKASSAAWCRVAAILPD